MSERPLAIAPAEPPEPRKSGVGMLFRKDAVGRWELLVGQRSRRSRFLPGHWACLGGSLEAQDAPEMPGAYGRCVARELAEETGIVVPVAQWLPAGFLVTPPFFPLRFYTEFLVAWAPPGCEAPAEAPQPQEIEVLRFVRPAELLERWERGEIDVPPILPPQLRVLAAAEGEPLEELARRLGAANLQQEACHRIEFIPGVWMLPLASRTLPPASHTNVWMPGGTRYLIVDPGTPEPREIERLLAVIRRRQEDGQRPEAIFLTHHHDDHVAGVELLASRLSLPVLAHAETLSRTPGLNGLDSREIGEGEQLDLDGMTLEVWHTPGHAPGHLALRILERAGLLVGDLLSAFSTIVIDSEEGSMEAYLASLRRVDEGAFRLLFPAHGPPLPGSAAARMLRHRRTRERQVLDLLSELPQPVAAIASAAYADTPRAPEPLIETQTLSILLELERRALAARVAEGHWVCRP